MRIKTNRIQKSVFLTLILSLMVLSAFAEITGVVVSSINPQDCNSTLVGRSFTWKVMPSQETGTGIIGAGGVIIISAPLSGTIDICIKVNGALSVKRTNINMTENENLGQISITMPDIGNDDVWDDFDLNEFNGGFGNVVTPGFGADYNCDGVYDDFDLNNINSGFGLTGDCYDGLTVHPGEWVYIPAGSFLMGNRGNEPFSYSHELPQHSVYVSGFWMGKYEVTRGEYRQFINAGGYSNSSYWSTDGWSWRTSYNINLPGGWAENLNWGSGTFTQTDNHPVVGVSYYEAEAYSNWAGCRLSTEAEWEKAARWDGSYPRTYAWGDSWNNEYCNNKYDTNPSGGGYYKSQTAPVGSYSQCVSYYGCYDMTGNVWEWCNDWYKSYPGSSNPFDYTGLFRVLRGGAFNSNNGASSNNFRCAYRDFSNGPIYHVMSTGFRIAR